MARRATRAHRTLYLLFCSCSTRSLTHLEQNCNLKSLGSVLTGAPRTERYRYLDLRGNQILASEMSKHVFCWTELAQLCQHNIQSTAKRCADLVIDKSAIMESGRLLRQQTRVARSCFLSISFVFEAILLRYLTHGENRGKEMTPRRRFATPQSKWLFKRGRRGKDMFLIQLFVNLNNCQ